MVVAAEYSISPRRVPLSYGAVASAPLLRNISGAAAVGDLLWMVSDEGRTVECLRQNGNGYVLAEQYEIDAIFPSFPGRGTKAELDLESVDIEDNCLWICGSHSHVRSKLSSALGAGIEQRPSRHLLAKIELIGDGSQLASAQCLPWDGPGSVRQLLAGNPALSPFLDLPCKENGLDIEGITVRSGSPMLGLRGPVVDERAVIVDLHLNDAFEIDDYNVHLLDLGGLGIRELARRGDDVLIIAGPVGEERAPFRLHAWQPNAGDGGRPPMQLFEWPESGEKPEGLCPMTTRGEPGLLVVFDSPTEDRIVGSTYSADWMTG